MRARVRVVVIFAAQTTLRGLTMTVLRWSRPRRRASIGIAAGLAAFAATAVLALTRNGGADSTPLPFAALSTLGHLRPIAAVGPTGPEGVPFREQVGSAHGHVTALFNGRVFTGSPRQIPLLAGAQIQLDVGRPLVAPERITFPNGL